jgi:hypothetical protein
VVEDMKKAYDKFNSATKKLQSKPCEKNEILLLGAERKLAKSVLDTKEVAEKLNTIISGVESGYDAISALLLDTNARSAASYAAKKNTFVERAVMAIDEIEQIVSDIAIPDAFAKPEEGDCATSFEPKPRVKAEGSWGAHTINRDMNNHKSDISYMMPHYKNIVRHLERAAIDLARLNRKHKRSSSRNKSAALEMAKVRYLEAVEEHNEFATDVNISIDHVFCCYDELMKTLSPKGRRALAKVASEQDKYSHKLQEKIDKLRAPIEKLGLKTIGAYPKK